MERKISHTIHQPDYVQRIPSILRAIVSKLMDNQDPLAELEKIAKIHDHDHDHDHEVTDILQEVLKRLIAKDERTYVDHDHGHDDHDLDVIDLLYDYSPLVKAKYFIDGKWYNLQGDVVTIPSFLLEIIDKTGRASASLITESSDREITFFDFRALEFCHIDDTCPPRVFEGLHGQLVLVIAYASESG